MRSLYFICAPLNLDSTVHHPERTFFQQLAMIYTPKIISIELCLTKLQLQGFLSHHCSSVNALLSRRNPVAYTAIQQNFIMSAIQPNESHQVRLLTGEHLPSSIFALLQPPVLLALRRVKVQHISCNNKAEMPYSHCRNHTGDFYTCVQDQQNGGSSIAPFHIRQR